MSKDRFINLIREFCRNHKIDDHMRIVHGGAVEAYGVQMTVVFAEVLDPPLVTLLCDMGERPSQREGDLYAKLLQKNFYLTSIGGPSFSIDPGSNRVSLIQSVALDSLTAESLADRLSNLANEANGWRYLPSTVAQIDDGIPLPSIARKPASAARSLHQLARR